MRSPGFYDTHAHLSYPEFAEHMPDVLARARQAGVTKLISVGTDLESSTKALELAARFPEVFAAVGWHPSDAAHAPSDWRPQLRELAAHAKVVALGETGLDYYRLPSRTPGRSIAEDEPIKDKQRRLFMQHLEVAAETGLPCVIHQRDSLEDTLAVLGPFAPNVHGVFHCFADDPAAMHRIIELGSLVSFTGILTYKNGQNVRDSLAATPGNKFMLETDCPYLAPVPHRGKRCEPAFVRETAAVAAQVRGCSLEDLSAATCATADEFFRLP
jgi:TatD DNase family protein